MINSETGRILKKKKKPDSDFWSNHPALRFTVCITPLAVFLTASVMADAQIHYNFINNTVFVLRTVDFRRV